MVYHSIPIVKPYITTIKLAKSTVFLLNRLKIHPRQSYDEAITLLLKSHISAEIKFSQSSGDITTIKLSKTNAKKLGSLKIHPRQPYDEVVMALIREHKEKNE